METNDTQTLEMVPASTAGPIALNPESLIARAIDKGVDVGTMERLLAMRRELKAEASKEAFDAAMAAFQAECPTIKKTKAVFVKGQLRYRYAPLEIIVEQVSPLLQKHGFSHAEDAEVEPGWVTGKCTVTHALGHSKTSSFKVPIQQDAYMGEAQKFASALTFAKRYAFIGAFGILTGDEDDDSQGAEENHPHAAAIPPARPPSPTAQRRTATEVAAQANGTKSLAERIAGLKAFLGNKAGWAEGYLRIHDVNGEDFVPALEPEGTIDQLSAERVDWIAKHSKDFLSRLEDFIASNGKEATDLAPAQLQECPQCKEHKLAVTGEKVLCDGCGYTSHCPHCDGYNLIWSKHESGSWYFRCEDCKKGQFSKLEQPKEIARTTTAVMESLPGMAESWRTFVMPFGKQKGTPMAQLDKKYLFGLWANYKVETHHEGKPRKKEWIEADRKLRAALDQAGRHYEFKA